ncbi:MAG: tRNA (N(6)-L-threonylcarbamoyladenosine(37)-C(2))-methylthiotransferase MtaB [Ignavibacteriales bacterium]|nr:tRNA (N(6)-L-threonylcarbamoyladenosine(37)-C(2))-methylthiotransferase MtaB [Ignavibacteriales bacterium]
MQKKVALYTLGCKLNYSETSTVGSQFMKEGYQIVDFDSEADVYLINTCTVTENAEKDCRQIVRRALKKNPDAFIAVTGCYAQLRPDEIATIKGVDAVLGSNEKFKLFSLIDNFEKKELACIHVSSTESLEHDFHAAASDDGETRTRAFLKIQDGCDYTCTFCTIPAARGKSRSQETEGALENFQKLLDKGFKEIIITGVNVGDYGKALNTNLYELLQKMIAIPGDFRLRISSIEPNLLTDEILELVAGSPKLCNHFHIPLQSGSAKILRLMQRRYNAHFYSELIEKIKNRIPDAGIGIDVIVGFPGESKEDFNETHQLLIDLPVSYLHVFTYSERPGTKAIRMPDTVEVFERRERNRILRILSEKKRHQFHESMLGKEVTVLFEHQDHDGQMKGFTENYIRVSQDFNSEKINIFTPAIIKEAQGTICFSSPLP